MHVQHFSHDKVWPFSWNVLELEIFSFVTANPNVTILSLLLWREGHLIITIALTLSDSLVTILAERTSLQFFQILTFPNP